MSLPLPSHNPEPISDGDLDKPPPPLRVELTRYSLNARSRLYDLIVQFRQDAADISDPQAKVLFELSAELLAGIARSFRNLEETQRGP